MATDKEAAARLIQEALAAYKADQGLDEEEEDAEPEETKEAGVEEGGAGGEEEPVAIHHEAVTKAVVASKKLSRFMEFELRKVNPHIVCKLCAGYFISATTIMECLHTFCKTCIVRYFQSSKLCPTCGIMVHETNPLEMLRQDRTIQSIVYKIVENLQKEETEREEAFYSSRGLKRPNAPEKRHVPEVDNSKKQKKKQEDVEPDDQISFVLEMDDGRGEVEDEGKSDKVTSLEKPYIRTSSRATILHLKKFLAKKLQLPGHEDVDILCRGEVLGKEYSLEYIARTRWRKEDQLILKYRSKIDFQAP